MPRGVHTLDGIPNGGVLEGLGVLFKVGVPVSGV